MTFYYFSAMMFERLFFRNFFPFYRFIYFIYKSFCERRAIASIKEHIRPGMRILDVGANIGFYSILFSRLVGDKGEVHAFEPDKDNFKRLIRCTRSLRNVVLNNKAVDIKTGTSWLYKSEDLNVDGRTYDTGEGRQKVAIDSIAIDDYFSNGEKVDAIKIDIQGYEYYAIKGMQKTIGRSEKVVMVGEFWPYGLVKAGTRPGDFIDLLEELGFKIEFDSPLNREQLISKQADLSFYVDFVAISGGCKN